MIDYERLKSLMQQYRELKKGYVFFRQDIDIYRTSSKINISYKISLEYDDSIHEENINTLLDEFELLINNIKAGIRKTFEIEHRGFNVTIFEMTRGYAANAKSDDREIQITLKNTYSSLDAEKKSRQYIDAFLLGAMK